MAVRRVDITGMYNNEATYPDLTLELRAGQSIKVHKAILSQANKYFEELCDRGAQRGGARCPQSIQSIDLRFSTPDALAAVLTMVRTIYGFPLPPADNLTWRAWCEVFVSARRHLDSDIRDQAAENFVTSALQQTDSEEVLKMVKKVGGHDNVAPDGNVGGLGKHLIIKLLRDDDYRGKAQYDTDTFWQLVDALLGVVEKDGLSS